MSWFTRTDILELFVEAAQVPARNSFRDQWWWRRELRELSVRRRAYLKKRIYNIAPSRGGTWRAHEVTWRPEPVTNPGYAPGECACCTTPPTGSIDGVPLCSRHLELRERAYRGGLKGQAVLRRTG